MLREDMLDTLCEKVAQITDSDGIILILINSENSKAYTQTGILCDPEIVDIIPKLLIKEAETFNKKING